MVRSRLGRVGTLLCHTLVDATADDVYIETSSPQRANPRVITTKMTCGWQMNGHFTVSNPAARGNQAMKLQLQLFAAAKEGTGNSVVSLELTDSATVADLRRRLVDLYPNLKSMANVLLVAVNSEYAADDRILEESDTVACFPPVSGG